LIERFRYVQLLGALVLLLTLNAFLREGVAGFALIDIPFFLVLASAVVACSTRPRDTAIGLSLAVIVQAAGVYRHLNSIEAVSLVYSTVTLIFLTYVTALVLSAVFRAKTVSMDTISGALAAYMLMGIGWAFAYAMLDALVPGSLVGIPEEAKATGYGRYLSYSFVTLTTLGYGDVVPGNEKAGALASLEAIVGQFYLTVLVARLVAMSLLDQARQSDENGDSK